jgi:hypothetical protein
MAVEAIPCHHFVSNVDVVKGAIWTGITSGFSRSTACITTTLSGNYRQPMPRGPAFNPIDYIQLADWTGRIIREDKTGLIE